MYRTKSAFNAGYPKTTLTLPKNTAAIQICPDTHGKIRLGTLMQLPSGARLEVIGDGFDENTARVAWEGSSYYIFLEESERRPLKAMASHAG